MPVFTACGIRIYSKTACPDIETAMASKGRPYKTIQVDGWEVLVGKGDAENDRLTGGVGNEG